MRKITANWQEVSLVIILLCLLFLCLQISWSLTDDGVTIQTAKNIDFAITHLDFRSVSGIFFDKVGGRFLPFKAIINWIFYLFVGTNAHLSYSIHWAILAITTLQIYRFTTTLAMSEQSSSVSKTGGLLGAILFSLSSINVDNWFRLGPQEPFLSLYLIVLLLILYEIFNSKKEIKKSLINSGILIFVFFYLTKETAIALIPFTLFVTVYTYIFKGAKSQTFKSMLLFSLMNLILGAMVAGTVMLVHSAGQYSGNYSVNAHTILQAFDVYRREISDTVYPFLWIFILSFVGRTLYKIFKKKKMINALFLWQIFSLVLALSCFLVLLPWDIPLNRYLMPVILPLSIFWGLEASEILGFLSKRNKVLAPLVLVIYLALFTYNNAFQFLNYYNAVSNATQNTEKILRGVASIALPNSQILINDLKSDVTSESITESSIHLAVIYNRPDLKVGYLNSLDGQNLVKGTLILSGLVPSNLEAYDEKVLNNDPSMRLVKSYNYEEMQYSYTLPTKEILLDTLTLKFTDLSKFRIYTKKTPMKWVLYQAN